MNKPTDKQWDSFFDSLPMAAEKFARYFAATSRTWWHACGDYVPGQREIYNRLLEMARSLRLKVSKAKRPTREGVIESFTTGGLQVIWDEAEMTLEARFTASVWFYCIGGDEVAQP